METSILSSMEFSVYDNRRSSSRAGGTDSRRDSRFESISLASSTIRFTGARALPLSR
jgi:hypothetical protein